MHVVASLAPLLIALIDIGRARMRISSAARPVDASTAALLRRSKELTARSDALIAEQERLLGRIQTLMTEVAQMVERRELMLSQLQARGLPDN
jgi:hypothetical protein